MGPEEFARWGKTFLDMGAAILGGCCGTTPDHIRALAPLLRGRKPRQRQAEEAVSRFCGWQGSRAHGPGLRRRRGGADQPHRPAEAEGGPVRQELGLRRGAGPPGAAGGGGLPGGQRRAPGQSTRGRPCPIWSWPSSGCRPCPWSSTAPTPPPWSGPSGSAGAGPS